MNKIIEEYRNEFTDTQDILIVKKDSIKTFFDKINIIDNIPIENILGQK